MPRFLPCPRTGRVFFQQGAKNEESSVLNHHRDASSLGSSKTFTASLPIPFSQLSNPANTNVRPMHVSTRIPGGLKPI